MVFGYGNMSRLRYFLMTKVLARVLRKTFPQKSEIINTIERVMLLFYVKNLKNKVQKDQTKLNSLIAYQKKVKNICRNIKKISSSPQGKTYSSWNHINNYQACKEARIYNPK